MRLTVAGHRNKIVTIEYQVKSLQYVSNAQIVMPFYAHLVIALKKLKPFFVFTVFDLAATA
jgi:hypothetical protein